MAVGDCWHVQLVDVIAVAGVGRHGSGGPTYVVFGRAVKPLPGCTVQSVRVTVEVTVDVRPQFVVAAQSPIVTVEVTVDVEPHCAVVAHLRLFESGIESSS